MKKFGTPIAAAPGSASEIVGFARVGVPSGACVRSPARWRLRAAFSRSRLTVFPTRPEGDCVFGVGGLGEVVLPEEGRLDPPPELEGEPALPPPLPPLPPPDGCVGLGLGVAPPPGTV